VPSFLQRIIRNGARPIPVAPRARRQPPAIALEGDHVVEPDAPPRVPPREQASSPPPSYASCTMWSERIAENPPSDEIEVRLPQSTGTFQLAAPPPGARPAGAMQTSAEHETVFRARPRELPDAKQPSGEAHPRPTLRQDAETELEAGSRQLEAVVAWVEPQPAPRTEVRQSIVRPSDRPADARPVGRTAIGRADAAIPPSAETPTTRPDRTRARETSVRVPSAVPAPPATTPLEPNARERSSAPAAADRLPRGARLTVNHLNVQIVNEDRSSRKEPPKPKTPSPSREPWGTFERRHLRVP
jgi:hypothetical protein